MLDVYKGQGVELFWTQNSECPKMSAYLEATALKTISAFVFALNLMQLFSENKEDLSYVMILFGN